LIRAQGRPGGQQVWPASHPLPTKFWDFPKIPL
jgi:hypothetical protein